MSVSSSTRNAPVAATIGLIVLGLLLVVVAVVYFTRSAGSLPAFFPGHQSGSSRHHTKHGIAMLALAVLCGVGAWFTTGRRKPAQQVP
jgi:hypothetical protein